MKLLRWLGLAQRTAPARPAAKPETREVGATGTPIFGGYLRDHGEYNSALEGLAAYSTYERMRRSDGQVAATLMAIKLPIRSAEWTVVEPRDASPVEKEAAEFAKVCLLEDIDWDAALENALLMLDFGASAHEDVWEIDGNRARIAKLAPRLPLTFDKWICAPGTDELVALQQAGWRGGEYVNPVIPVEQLALFTFQQEGANYAGRSLLRSMYQHWYVKSNLYKVDAIACERNGMGIPWVKMAKDPKAEDKATAAAWLARLTTHEAASILLPPEWEFGLRGVEGAVRDPKDSIHHHNVMISMVGLAQFMMLGESQSGNRALGQTLSDFFYMAVQATANRIARVMNQTTLRRLVDYNFAGVERYPRLVPQQVMSVQFESIVTALKDLAAANAVQPDDELEGWLRSKMGAPAPGKPRKSPTAAPAAAQERADEGGKGVDTPETRSGPENAKSDVAMSERPKLRREPGTVGSERARRAELCLALSEVASVLDKGRDEIAAALRAALPAVRAEAVQRLMSMPVRRMHQASVPAPEKLIGQVEEILRGMYQAGVRQVEGERVRQAGGAEPGDAAVVRLAERASKREPLGVYADGVVADFLNQVVSRAATAAMDWQRRPGDLTKGEVIKRIEEDLDDQSDKWMDGVAAKGANEAFADGRSDGYEEHKDEIQAVVYSALLDLNTCEACAAADGKEGATPEEIPDVPNPDCLGGDRCRCVHVYVFADEVRQ